LHELRNSDVIIPRMSKIHRALALALANSPARLTDEQLRFLRKHLGLTGDQLGRYLIRTEPRSRNGKRGEDRIGPATDRLIRLLVAALDSELRPGVLAIAEHLPLIADLAGNDHLLHVDAATLQTGFFSVLTAA
jgi:DNA-binding transcriptional regulator YiaG